MYYARKFVHSVGSLFFLFGLRLPTPFIQKEMTAVGLGQQGSQAVGPGSSLCRAKYVYDFTDNFQKFHSFHSNGFHGTMRRTTGF